MSEWIKITDLLPETYEHVLLYGHEGVFRGFRNDFEDFHWEHYPKGDFATGAAVFGITHWMPLPVPPKSEFPNNLDEKKQHHLT